LPLTGIAMSANRIPLGDSRFQARHRAESAAMLSCAWRLMSVDRRYVSGTRDWIPLSAVTPSARNPARPVTAYVVSYSSGTVTPIRTATIYRAWRPGICQAGPGEGPACGDLSQILARPQGDDQGLRPTSHC
jgi:hypothetical protein